TDLASIPRIFRWLLNQNGNSRRPAVLHDYLYRMQPISRAEADAIFRRALEAEGVILPGRWLYWSGVRMGGWIAWRGHRCALIDAHQKIPIPRGRESRIARHSS